jgi:transposase InsO family protein
MAEGRFPVTAIAAALTVARSNLLTPPGTPRRYHKVEDDEILPAIRRLIADRPTYGYRRVTALLNRERAAQGGDRFNPKRIYRIMKTHHLLLTRGSGRPTYRHEGTVITLTSNLRWCSDTFVIRCWNGEHLEVAFSLDTCDREVIAWSATTGAVTGAMIRDLMIETVERRWGPVTSVPRPIQWLSDNGPPYTAEETRTLGAQLGLVVCTTPVYSPESNGMAEGFIKTFKRDYVYLARLDTAEAVLQRLGEWFEDYNEKAPHKGLSMRSPREFLYLNRTVSVCPV